MRGVPRIHWTADMPPEVRKAAEPYIRKWVCLVPSWVLDLKMGVTWDETQLYASSWSDQEYRRAGINLCPGWLAEDEDSRENILVHELVHMAVGPLDECAKSVVRHTIGEDNEALYTWANDQISKALEGAVEDLTESIHRHLSAKGD